MLNKVTLLAIVLALLAPDASNASADSLVLAATENREGGRSWTAALNTGHLSASPEVIHFLHDGNDISFVAHEVGEAKLGVSRWFGRSATGSTLRYVARNELVAGRVDTAHESYYFYPLDSKGRYSLIASSGQRNLKGCAEGGEEDDELQVSKMFETCNDPSQFAEPDSIAQIDVMLLYTPSTATASVDIAMELQGFIDHSNSILVDNNLMIRFRLVHAGPTPNGYDDSNDLADDLLWLREDQDVSDLRDEHSADLVGLFVRDSDTERCGIARVMRRQHFGLKQEGRAFSVTALDCERDRGTVLTHEFGHNMGLEHEIDESNAPTPNDASFCFSFGYLVSMEFRSIMSVNPQEERIGRFSNPDVDIDGHAFGIEGEADNQQAISLTAPFVEKFRPENDHFDKSTTLVGIHGSLDASNHFATSEVGEPSHDGTPSARSIWWHWSAPRDGIFQFNAKGIEFEDLSRTILSIYTGTSIEALNEVTSGSQGVSTSVSFSAESGQQYRIAVDSDPVLDPEAKGGNISLSWSPFPDVDADDWFRRPALYLFENEVIDGLGNGDFGGDLEATRAEILKMSYLGKRREPDVSPDLDDPGFPDVDPDNPTHWFWPYVFDGVNQGYIEGRECENGMFGFCPHEPANRYEAAKIVHAVFEGVDYSDPSNDGSCDEAPTETFPDVQQDDWYCAPVSWMSSTRVEWNGAEPRTIAAGYQVPDAGNYFGGDQVDTEGELIEINTINRAEMAWIISSAMNHAGTGGDVLPLLDDAPPVTSAGGLRGSTLVALGKEYEQDIDPTNINPPEIFELPGGNRQTVSGPILLNGLTHDPDGDELFYFWASTGGSLSTIDPENYSNVTWAPPMIAPEATYVITVVNGDRRGKVGRTRLELTVPGEGTSGTNTPSSGALTSPSGTQTGNVTVEASASDSDGLQRVTVTFVSGGQELVLCDVDGANPCAGTSGNFSVSDVDPSNYGAIPGSVTLHLFVEDSLDDIRDVAQRSFTFDPPSTGPSFTLTVRKQGDGDGTISGGGLNCGTGCSTSSVLVPEDSSVTLTGAADSSSVFVGFAGERCYGVDPCTFTLNRDYEIFASFGLPDSLSVLFSTPTSGDSNASPDGYVTLNFNREVNPGGNIGGIVYRETGGSDVSFQAVISDTGSNPRRRLTLLPDQPLERGVSYEVSVPAGAVEDDFGEELATPYGINFTVAADDFTGFHAAVYPYFLMERDDTLLSTWLTQPTPINRTVTITSSPTGLLEHPSQVTIPAGEILEELFVEAANTPGSTAHSSATLIVTDPVFGQVSVPVQILNHTTIPGSSLRWQASSVSGDDNGNGIFEAGESADVFFYVANVGGGTLSNVELEFDVLNTSNLRLLGGSGARTCNLGSLGSGQSANCDRNFLAQDDLPTGMYYIEVIGRVNGSMAFLDHARVSVVNNELPDYTITSGSITGSELQPGTVIDFDVAPRNSSDGFDVRLVTFEVVLEGDGVEQVLYRTVANARGDIFSSQEFTLPVVYPSTPGEHPLRVRINPPGDDHIPESNSANNEGIERVIRVAGPNLPPVLEPIPGPVSLAVGESLTINATATDPNDDPITYSLEAGAPAGMSIAASSGLMMWTPQCGQEGPLVVEIIATDNEDASDSEMVTINVGTSGDLEVHLDSAEPVGLPGTATQWTLAVTNLGPSCIQDAEVSNLLPVSLLNGTWTCSATAGSSCSASGAGDVLDTIDLLAGGGATYTITTDIADGANGSIVSTATATVSGDAADANSSNNSSTATVTLRDLDFGDAPSPSLGGQWAFPTALAENGARHGIDPGLYFGSVIDAEPEGQSTLAADGDDLGAADDDDGVELQGEMEPCQTTQVEVTASSVALLNAWVDFNTDGDWEDAGEQIFTDHSLNAGLNTLSVSVPCEATPSSLAFARFRLSSTGGLPSHGLALDGEVEDHGFLIAQVFRDLDVSLSGEGVGTVVASPNGILCGEDCSESYPIGSVVVLSANPAIGSEFGGWSGGGCSGTGTCVLPMDSARAVTATFTVLEYSLDVSVAGDGNGTVTSNPAGINCGADCSEDYGHGSIVTLTATPEAGSEFVGWGGGGCSGTDACLVSVEQSTAVTASFALLHYALDVSKTGNGTCTVLSSPAGIDCGADCGADFSHGVNVTLSVLENTGSEFTGWSGSGCSGIGDCILTMDAAKVIEANCQLSTYSLTVTKGGVGSGVVTSDPAGIDCGGSCTTDFTHGTSVTLTATADEGFEFAGWSEPACPDPGPCTVSVTEEVLITATFDLPPNESPSITLAQPDGIGDIADTTFTISWTDSDPDSDAAISLHYDTDNAGANGTVIIDALSEDNEIDSFLWDTSIVPAGDYYIYAVIGDGENTPAVDYSDGVVTILHADPPIEPQPQFLWAKQHGGWSADAAAGSVTDAAGNLLITGTFRGNATFDSETLVSAGSNDIFVAKLDPTGQVIWVEQAGGAETDVGRDIAVGSLNEIHVVGSFIGDATFGETILASSGVWDIFLAKYAPTGQFLWATQAGGAGIESGVALVVDANGNSIITGSFEGVAWFGETSIESAGITDIFIAKYDPDGNLLWVQQAGGTGQDGASDLVLSADGSVVITGFFRESAQFGSISFTSRGSADVFVAKYDSGGVLIWVEQAGGTSHDSGQRIAVDSTGNIVITGSFVERSIWGNTVLVGNQNWEVFVVKYDPNGQVLWAKKGQGTGPSDHGRGIATDSVGSSTVTGSFQGTIVFGTETLTAYGTFDTFIVKYDINGNVLWARQIGSTENIYGNGLVEGADGGLRLVGQFSGVGTFDDTLLTSAGSSDSFVARLGGNTPPAIEILEPDGIGDVANSSFAITWNDSDADDDASIQLYRDTDNTGSDGILINPAAIGEDDKADSYLWDVSSVPEGIYYIYAVIDDGVNEPVTAYSTGTVTVERLRFLLTVSSIGSGQGTVESTPIGIECGADCSEEYIANTVVTLIATPDIGSTLAGWNGGGCMGVGSCTVIINEAAQVTANFELQTFSATVARAGSGSGTVSSNPPGIDCGTDCSEDYPFGTVLTLAASPDAGSEFSGWSGSGCSGTGTCVLTVDSVKNVSATFTVLEYSLDVSLVGNGSGVITSNPAGIDCGSDCAEDYNHGSVVTLAAMPEAGSEFVGWNGGGCSGTGTCLVTMEQATAVAASFDLLRHALDVSKSGNGSCSVTSSPAGINCGADCSEEFDQGTSVTLSVGVGTGSEFVGWTGSSCSGTSDCNFSMDAARAVDADCQLTTHSLTVTKVGGGGGLVVSDPAGINCGGSCTAGFAYGTSVTLTATAGSGSIFAGWNGAACAGTDPCTLQMVEAATVAATFEPATYSLDLEFIGSGAGTVDIDPPGSQCSDDCLEDIASGTTVTLTIMEGIESTFVGWDGACSSTAPCILMMDQARVVTVDFDLNSYLLEVTRTGGGSGRVTSDPEGVDCGEDCDEMFSFGSSVSLEALPGNGSHFDGWNGGGCAETSPCEVTIEQAVSVEAVFETSCVDSIETGSADWLTMAGPNDGGASTSWEILADSSHTGLTSWFVAEEDLVKDQLLIGMFSIPVSPDGAQLRFWHRYDTELGADGGVLEYSVDGGSNWFDILSGDGDQIPGNANRFLQNGYISTLGDCCSNPLADREAWSGLMDWQETAVDLTDFATRSVRMRWRFGADSAIAEGLGWWIDDVEILDERGCPLGTIFGDEFEAGDTSAWSATTP